MRIDTARIGQLVLGFSTTSRERAAQRERVFFGEDDDALYRDLLASQCRKHERGGLLPID